MRMALGENAKMALDTLRENKMRSFLTVLGVVIGITALITVASILVGFYADVTAYLDDYGPNTIWVFKVAPGVSTGRMTAEERNRKSLTLEDGLAIEEECPEVEKVSITVFKRFMTLIAPPLITARYEDKEISGLDYMERRPNYENVFNIRPTSAGFSTKRKICTARMWPSSVRPWQDVFHRRRCAGQNDLCGGISLSRDRRVRTPQGTAFPEPGARKNRCWCRFAPTASIIPKMTNILLPPGPPGRMAEAQDEIRAVLRRRRHVPYSAPDNFGLSTAQEMADQFKQITGSVALLTAVVSSIGLLVGGVGVMNIMLMSVTQRTREIGVRKAIGARRRDVVWQFLTEAIVLTGVGGIIGVLLAMAISLLINVFLPSCLRPSRYGQCYWP